VGVRSVRETAPRLPPIELTLNLSGTLDLGVGVAAMLASERHDDDFAEVWDAGQQHSGDALEDKRSRSLVARAGKSVDRWEPTKQNNATTPTCLLVTLHTKTLGLLNFLLVALLEISTFLQANVIIVDLGSGLGILGDLADGFEEVRGFGHGVRDVCCVGVLVS